jgi:hypothetical protein
MSSVRYMILIITVIGFNRSYGQSSSVTRIDALLQSYIDLKNVMASGDSEQIKSKTQQFIYTTNRLSLRDILEGNRDVLLMNAQAILDEKETLKRNEHFQNLSENIVQVATKLKHTLPIKVFTCPTDKIKWIDTAKESKNPTDPKSNCAELTGSIN